MMSRFTFPLFIAVICLNGFQFAAGQETVKIVLSVVEIDKNGERPANNKRVTIIPKNQGVKFERTDANGQIAFRFPSTQSVTFYVGEPGNDARLQPLSGRTDQSTSYLIDRRTSNQPRTISYGTVSAGGGGGGVSYDTSSYRFVQLLGDLETQSGGRLMSQQSREYARSLRPAIIKATTPNSNASEDQRKSFANTQERLLSRLDEMLKPPFRMGATVQDTPLGVRINSVQQGGPADIAGLKPGDIITHVGFLPVADSPNSFRWMIGNSPKSNTGLKVTRGNRELQINISLVR